MEAFHGRSEIAPQTIERSQFLLQHLEGIRHVQAIFAGVLAQDLDRVMAFT